MLRTLSYNIWSIDKVHIVIRESNSKRSNKHRQIIHVYADKLLAINFVDQIQKIDSDNSYFIDDRKVEK